MGSTSKFEGLYLNDDCEIVAKITDNHEDGLTISGSYTIGMLERNLEGGDESVTVNLSTEQRAAHNEALGEIQEFLGSDQDLSTLPSHDDTNSEPVCAPQVSHQNNFTPSNMIT